MTPEQIAALQAAVAEMLKPITAQLATVNSAVEGLKSTTAADKAALDKAAADKAAADKAAADKASADKHASDNKNKTPEQNAADLEQKQHIANLNKQMADLVKKSQDSEAKAQAAVRQTAIDKALNDFNFVAPSARADAFQLLDAAVKVTDNGTLVAGDNLPLDAYAKNFFTVEKPYLLAPANAGGSGGQNGNSTGIGRGTVATTEMITPTMSAETRTSVLASIQAALGR